VPTPSAGQAQRSGWENRTYPGPFFLTGPGRGQKWFEGCRELISRDLQRRLGIEVLSRLKAERRGEKKITKEHAANGAGARRLGTGDGRNQR